jgi:hypothetical protein
MTSIRRFGKAAALLFVLSCAFAASALAADISGTWISTFNTQIGEQHYTYTFAVDGEKLTGKAKNDMGETTIKDGSITGDDIKFTEVINFQGQDLTITYTGKIRGDEIKFTRQVGTFATEELVAKRQK